MKHKLVLKPAWAQVMAYRKRYAHARIVLIDGNAGDGAGIMSNQSDLFDGPVFSVATPVLLNEIAEQAGHTDLYLCEKNYAKRRELREQFPHAVILADHNDVARFIAQQGNPYRYALWLSDPCGPAGQGVAAMRALGRQIPHCDYVVILNEGAIQRIAATKPESLAWAPHREKYPPMLEWQWWLKQLDRRYIARTGLVQQSPGFKFRMLVVANYLAETCRRAPFTEIREKNK
jgi:hypothetical protein